VFSVECSLPTNWGNIDAVKGINATGFAEGSPPKGFLLIDEQTKALEVVNDELCSFSRYLDVITKHKYSTGLMKPMALQ
jgi:hypothetical protein